MTDVSAPIADARLLPRLLRLALPALAEQSLTLLVTWIDTWLTSHFLPGDRYLAAMNQVNYLLWLVPSLFTFVGIGATAVVARFVGADDRAAAKKVMHQSFLVGVVIVIGMGLIALCVGRDFLHELGLRPETADLAAQFLRYVLPVVPFIMLEQIGNACLRGSGDTVTGLIAMILVNVVNMTIGTTLLIGWGPFKKLGWEGIAIGTASGYAVGGLIIAFALSRGRSGLRFERRMFRPDFDLIRRVLRIGVPGGMDIVALISCQLWFVSIINRLGDAAAAAHGVAIRIEALAYLPGLALQIAATTLAGQYLGARDSHNARRSALTALFWSTLLMSTVGCLFYFGAHPLVGWFLGADRQDLVATTAPLIQTIAFGMPALAAIQIFTGTLRGSGDTRIPLLVTFFGFLVVRIPLTYLLTAPTNETFFGLRCWGMGVQGAWCAMVTDLFARSLPLAIRFFQGGWQRVKV